MSETGRVTTSSFMSIVAGAGVCAERAPLTSVLLIVNLRRWIAGARASLRGVRVAPVGPLVRALVGACSHDPQQRQAHRGDKQGAVKPRAGEPLEKGEGQ